MCKILIAINLYKLMNRITNPLENDLEALSYLTQFIKILFYEEMKIDLNREHVVYNRVNKLSV